DREGPGFQNCSFRKGEPNITGKLITAQVFEKGLGVVNLNVFEAFAVISGSRMVHQFGNDQTSAPTARRQRFQRNGSAARRTRNYAVPVPELARGNSAGGMAGHGHAQDD